MAALCLASPAIFACGDDGGGASGDSLSAGMTNQTSLPATGGQTTSGEPTSEGPPTTTEGGSVSQGTDSAATGSTGEPGTSTVDPSGPSSTGETSNMTTADTGDTGDTGSSGLPPMCTDADCVVGQYCNANTGLCEPGCNDEEDCMGETVCDVEAHACEGCLTDANCGLGTVCENKVCVPGCNEMQPCQDGLACCDGQCFDLLTDVDHCGACVACPVPENATASCTMGVCGLGACVGDFNNCDKDPNNGCEVDGSCECTPGEQIACYSGPEGSENKGICKGGLQTCNPQGTAYGPCQGEVLPGPIDICANNLDDDCDGVKDEDPDEDGDGWTVCGGDCCDAIGPTCLNPTLVNPGAFEFQGNMVDDDCDGVKDNPVPVCDNGLASNSNVPNDYVKAIDLCQFTVENPPNKKDKKWGVISSGLFRGDGAGAPDAAARSIRPGFGTGGIVPQQNNRLAVFSTGNAADFNDASPAYADFQTGKDNGANSGAPADWLAANGNQFPNAPTCPGAGSNQAFNSVMLKIRVRVPTNAKSFNVQMYFMSAEWPEWTCTAFNDMFVTLLDSTGAGNPVDKNIAIYSVNNQKYPVGVNLVKAAPGLFTQCKNGTFGCSGVNGGNYNGCVNFNQLAGTGMEILEGGCGTNNTTGGGTNWLKMSGNVKGGETMEIRFVIWDTADGIYDSLVLLDDWVWSVQASQPGVQPN